LARGGCTTSLLRCRCSPCALSRSTVPNRRLIPPSPLPADSEFRSSIRVSQRRAPLRPQLSGHARESPDPSSRRNRCIPSHPHPKSSPPLRVRQKTARHQHYERRAPASSHRREFSIAREQIVRKNAKSFCRGACAKRLSMHGRRLIQVPLQRYCPFSRNRRGSQVVRSRLQTVLYPRALNPLPFCCLFHAVNAPERVLICRKG